MKPYIDNLTKMVENFQSIKKSLPWLDMCFCPEDHPAFGNYAAKSAIPCVNRMTLENSMLGKIFEISQDRNVKIFTYNNEKSGQIAQLKPLMAELAAVNVPLSFHHTDIDIQQIAQTAMENPELKVIIESGPRKILYFIDEVKNALKRCRNLYLCTYNFCNWMGIDEICSMELGSRLLFGSHMPSFNEDASMGPVIMSNLSWEQKCNIAGNNLRNILKMATVYPEEVEYISPESFIIDSHTHSVAPYKKSPLSFYTPDCNFSPADWLKVLDSCSIETIILAPMESLMDYGKSSRNYYEPFRNCNHNRFRYFEIFNPRGDNKHVDRVCASMADPDCLGIKIHPVEHKTEADNDAYAIIYSLASKYRKPILTHSWEISDYNLYQYMSHPDRFRRFLKEFPDVILILGHAGGRPGAFEAVEKLCAEYSNVFVDIAGDYYDNGLIEALTGKIGADKILFASDMDWIDPRCNIASVLNAKLAPADKLKILRFNAQRVFYKLKAEAK